MAQQPAVVIIARHGPRLDAADQSWHLSTPTPYDPPLTYGGWNQCRSLGVRIASLLHAREQSLNDETPNGTTNGPDGITIHDFAQQNSNGRHEPNLRKRKRKHKVVIHSSPFLRCLQTSVAISAGMAQFQPPSDSNGMPSTSGSSKSRTPSSMHSASPRLRGMEGATSPTLSLHPIAEPKHDLAHAIARRVLNEHKRHRQSKLRVDAFLGEWLNPQYFDQITPPPPSAMMVATAKAELIHTEPVDIFTPTLSTKSSNHSLWGGTSSQRQPSRESTLDDFSDVQDTLNAPTPRRDRTSSFSSVGSNDSGSGRRSPFRPGHVMQPFASNVPKPETTVYVPPTPQYAVSGSDYIPRGYVSHARQACVNVDYQWDSSRPPQDWGDGGEYGEEWSAMHKRFRRGLNHLVHWYSQHNADDRAEDSLGFDQAERHEEDHEEQEDLVLILVTHGAGSNALIGALTGQPVLLDVGMASLTMAVKRDDAPPLSALSASDSPRHSPTPDNIHSHARRGSVELGLSSIYEMKLVSSSEHLRPGADPTRPPPSAVPAKMRSGGAIAPYSQRFGSGSHAAAGAGIESNWNSSESRSNTNSSLGSMRRPSLANIAVHANGTKGHSMPAVPQVNTADVPTQPLSPGLWTPPASRTPLLQAAKIQEERANIFSQLNDAGGRVSPGRDLVLDFSNSPPDSRPTSSSGSNPPALLEAATTNSLAAALNGSLDGASDERPTNGVKHPQPPPTKNGVGNERPMNGVTSERPKHGHRDSISALPKPGSKPPQDLGRTLSQKGLWGNKPAGDRVARLFRESPKRRWTVNQDDYEVQH